MLAAADPQGAPAPQLHRHSFAFKRKRQVGAATLGISIAFTDCFLRFTLSLNSSQCDVDLPSTSELARITRMKGTREEEI